MRLSVLLLAPVLSLMILTLSSRAHAASHVSGLVTGLISGQCSGEIATPLYHCINLDGAPDIRLYVQEFQTCVNGKITEFDRTINAFYFQDDIAGNFGGDSEARVANIVFAKDRKAAPERGDDLTFIPPTSAVIQTSEGGFKLKMTTETAPDYDGAPNDHYHYVGSFEQYARDNKLVKSGRLACFVTQ